MKFAAHHPTALAAAAALMQGIVFLSPKPAQRRTDNTIRFIFDLRRRKSPQGVRQRDAGRPMWAVCLWKQLQTKWHFKSCLTVLKESAHFDNDLKADAQWFLWGEIRACWFYQAETLVPLMLLFKHALQPIWVLVKVIIFLWFIQNSLWTCNCKLYQ